MEPLASAPRGDRKGTEVAGMVYVWLGEDLDLQHTTAAPADDTAREWDGATVCGLTGSMR